MAAGEKTMSTSAAVETACTLAEAREITNRFRAAAQNLADAITELREVVPIAYASGA